MSENEEIGLIRPQWPAPSHVHACSTSRQSGVSEGVYAGLNLALHVEDSADHVMENRRRLKQQLNLPAEPLWLEQVHGKKVVDAGQVTCTPPQADASYSRHANTVCSVMTADCLPVLFCNRSGDRVAAAHAGWRGLADDVLEATISAMSEPAENLLAWMGPAIGAKAFEVGSEVRDVFIRQQEEAEEAFTENRPGHYLADIYQLASLRLKKQGVLSIYGGEYCTYTDADHFYSYRRDGKTGRQASMIWFNEA